MKTGKIFLLFGSTGDLGRAAVNYFLDMNYDYYYFFSRNKFNIESKKNNFETVAANDFTNEENIIEAFSKIKRNKDTAYFLFSTVGGFAGGKPISETSYSDFLNMLNVNLCTSFLIAKHFVKLTEGTKGGSLCFTSAYSSLKPEANKAAYNISKNGLNMLVKSLALECSQTGLSVNAVAPYIIDTEANREWMKDLSQMVTPAEICRLVQSLFEDNAASTGKIIELQGAVR